MFGERGIIGFISPTILTNQVLDFYQIAPKGVNLASTTLGVENTVFEELCHNREGVLEAARKLERAGAQVVVAGG